VKHLVDFLTIYHRPTKQQPCEELELLTAPSVKELHQAGVKFVQSSSKNLLDIKFDKKKKRETRDPTIKVTSQNRNHNLEYASL